MELLTITEIAKALAMPESTVRYYRDRFSDVLPSVGHGRSRRYLPETLQILREIVEQAKAGIPLEELHQSLVASVAAEAAPAQDEAAGVADAAPAADDPEASAGVALRQEQKGELPHQVAQFVAAQHQLVEELGAVRQELTNLRQAQANRVAALEACLAQLQEDVRKLVENHIAQRDAEVLEELAQLREKHARRRRWWWPGARRLASH